MNPLLYTFRRCPFAIRARLAINISGYQVEHCEVDLRNKPQALLECSPKGTVPVLQLADGRVIEESLDIMQWVLSTHDPENWLGGCNGPSAETMALINRNDHSFKPSLDRYKYAVRFPEHSVEYYREQAALFLQELEIRLSQQPFLNGDQRSLADMAILPFVRQFSNVDNDWFNASNYRYLIKWLDTFLESTLFKTVIEK
ncbi:MAG: glutathione S-transferase [Nitrosomonas sp.]|nr:glutathione S-transferase [Nitrosomonas sp.]MDP1950976.1 glutathione S-transferase [Nitrosomonas sp.]